VHFQQCNGLCHLPVICCDIRYSYVEEHNTHSICLRLLKNH
jgi:hypothetical protein